MTETQKAYLCAFGAVFIWSGFILASRQGGISELLSHDVIAIRHATSASILLPLWWFKFRFKLLDGRLFIASLIGGLAYALCTFRGFETAPASHAALLLPGLIPFFVILLGAAINREDISTMRGLGLGSICLGIALLFFLQDASGAEKNTGDLWFVAGALCWGMFSILIKRWNISPWQATVSLSVFTCALYLPVYLIWLPSMLSLQLWPDILLQAVYQGVLATIIQMVLYVRAVQMLGAATMGSLMAIVPVISGTAALFLFNEDASIGFFTGLLFVSIGVWFSHNQKSIKPFINHQENVSCPTSISK